MLYIYILYHGEPATHIQPPPPPIVEPCSELGACVDSCVEEKEIQPSPVPLIISSPIVPAPHLPISPPPHTHTHHAAAAAVSRVKVGRGNEGGRPFFYLLLLSNSCKVLGSIFFFWRGAGRNGVTIIIISGGWDGGMDRYR